MNIGVDIAVPAPFSFALTVRKPAGWHWATPYETFEDGVLLSALRLPGNKLVGLRVWQERGGVRIRAQSPRPLSAADRQNLTAMMRLGLGAGEDLKGFYTLARTDPLVRRLKRDLYGLRTGFPGDVYDRCLLAITLQMAPMRRSTGMRSCLIENYGQAAAVDGRRIPYWPAPQAIAREPAASLAKKCRLGYRAEAIRRVARTLSEGFPNIVELNRMDEPQITARLLTLYGVGTYSAQLISPRRGFPLDVWSARIFHEILFGTTPRDPRRAIKLIDKEADERWGTYKSQVFVYVLNDLARLQEHYPISKLT